MKSVVLRLLERERGLFAGALVIAAACAALGVPFDFVLFGLTLAGVALFHHHTLQVALIGLAVIVLYKLGFTGFKTGAGMPKINIAAPAATHASSTCSGSTPSIHIIVVVVSPTTLPEPPAFDAATMAAR